MEHIESLFNEASYEQMEEIAKMFNNARSAKALSAAKSFQVGQSVSWMSNRSGPKTGVIKKINKKNILVNTENGQWQVPASLLKAA
tara:strand:+ start:147 stop:404 length:258 start_codon:yes stop_codon:yes gene_type:complete